MRRLVVFFVLLPYLLAAQSLKYPHWVIDTLAAPSLQGRAYCTDGNALAANFIVSQLDSLMLKPFNSDYRQKFSLSANCITDTVSLYFESQKLVLGKDYVVWGSTPEIHGSYRVKRIKNPEKWKKLNRRKISDVFIVVDDNDLKDRVLRKVFYTNELGAKGVIILKEHFYYVPSAMQNSYPLIFVKPEKYNQKIKNVTIDIDAKQVTGLQTQNIVGYIEGQVDSFIVFSAHYDHLGRLGQIYFPGANDNASGVAMVLDLARILSQRKCKPHYSIAFMFFSGEELGLLGSAYYVENPLFDLSKIKLLINLDMVGSGDEGITVVNAKNNQSFYEKLVSINDQKHYLPSIKARGQAANSDHYYFAQKGVPAIFIYTRGAYKEYHNIYDTAQKLPLNKFIELESLLLEAISY